MEKTIKLNNGVVTDEVATHYIKLNNGVEIPIIGYGVFQVDPAECERCVTNVLAVNFEDPMQRISLFDIVKKYQV